MEADGVSDTKPPAPLVPAEVDLRDFAFVPLEFRRLFTSETWILGNPEERCAALCLWCESWHQTPAGSVPDNDRILAHLSQAGSRWKKLRGHALRGWRKCSDGRLYHPVVCEKVMEAWAKHKKASSKGKAGALKRWGTGNASANSTGINQLMPGDSNGNRNGNDIGNDIGQGHGIPPTDSTASPSSPPVGKTVARKRAAIRPDGVSEKVWDDFMEVRKAKRAPLTDTALNGIVREADKAGLTLQAALEVSCARGWQGFEAAWMKGSKPTDNAAAFAEAKRKLFGEERDVTDEADRI